MNTSSQELFAIADVLMNVLDRDVAQNVIVRINNLEGGSEILRQIVRDDIGGASDLISNTLWCNI